MEVIRNTKGWLLQNNHLPYHLPAAAPQHNKIKTVRIAAVIPDNAAIVSYTLTINTLPTTSYIKTSPSPGEIYMIFATPE